MEVKSWRGFCAIVYRNYSGFIHPGYRGLNPVVVAITPTRKRVQLSRPTRAAAVRMAMVIFGLSLSMVSDVLGWPDADAITAIFERYP